MNPNPIDSLKPEFADSVGMAQRAKLPILSEEAVALWSNLVTGIIRKAKGLKPEDEVALPNGETGRYIKYALDNKGRLSMGKGRGRLHVRMTSKKATGAKLLSQLFGGYMTSLFKAANATAKEGEPITPITQEEVNKAQAWAFKKAGKLLYAPEKAKRRAANLRQRCSRRINTGLQPGNMDRRSHAEV